MTETLDARMGKSFTYSRIEKYTVFCLGDDILTIIGSCNQLGSYQINLMSVRFNLIN